MGACFGPPYEFTQSPMQNGHLQEKDVQASNGLHFETSSSVGFFKCITVFFFDALFQYVSGKTLQDLGDFFKNLFSTKIFH